MGSRGRTPAGCRTSCWGNCARVFSQQGVRLTNELDAKVVKASYLTCFLFGYEFTDESKTAQISLRSYYYTKQATFVVTFSCDKDYYARNAEAVRLVLESLNTEGD